MLIIDELNCSIYMAPDLRAYIYEGCLIGRPSNRQFSGRGCA